MKQGQIGINKNTNTNKSKSQAIGVGVGVGLSKSSNKGNTNNINIDGDDIDPPAYAPGVAVFNPTAPCMVPASGSVGALGLVSLGAAGGYINKDCQELEDAKALCKVAQQYKDNKDLQERCVSMMIEATSSDEKVAYFRDPASGKIVRKNPGQKMPNGQVALVRLAGAPDNVNWERRDDNVIALADAE